MPFVSINSTNPKTNPWKVHKKILRIGVAGKWGFLCRPFWIFWVSHFDFFFASYLWKIQPFYMRYHFFLHCGWFFQNLGKEAVQTFMHTTVHMKIFFLIENFGTFWWYGELEIEEYYFRTLHWGHTSKVRSNEGVKFLEIMGCAKSFKQPLLLAH